MRVVIVNCFDTYEDRVDLIHDYFKTKNHEVTVVQSNYRHFKKVKRTEDKNGFIFIDTEPYMKNLSFNRMKSHYYFAKNAFKIVDEIKPDLLYVLIPPNSLTKFAGDYKKKNNNVKLIFDLIDLWPETMPLGIMKEIFPFNLWKNLRNYNLKYADLVVTECDLYQTVLTKVLKDLKTKTMYLAKKNVEIAITPYLSKDEINLCYLGSINNIIDIPKIKEIVNSINNYKPTTLHIIGDGESRDILIDEIKATGASVKYYGKIYDPYQKQDIFNKCHFGLNIMKETVCVGLTMKSIDYFQGGLPIINNIKADTENLVRNYNIGFNVSIENVDNIGKVIFSLKNKDYYILRKNTNYAFEKLFSTKVFDRKLDEILNHVSVKGDFYDRG